MITKECFHLLPLVKSNAFKSGRKLLLGRILKTVFFHENLDLYQGTGFIL